MCLRAISVIGWILAEVCEPVPWFLLQHDVDELKPGINGLQSRLKGTLNMVSTKGCKNIRVLSPKIYEDVRDSFF